MEPQPGPVAPRHPASMAHAAPRAAPIPDVNDVFQNNFVHEGGGGGGDKTQLGFEGIPGMPENVSGIPATTLPFPSASDASKAEQSTKPDARRDLEKRPEEKEEAEKQQNFFNFSTPTVSIPTEHGENVELYLKVRGLKSKSKMAKTFCGVKRGSDMPPEALMKNGKFVEWSLTDQSVAFILKVRKAAEAGERRKDPTANSDHLDESFKFKVNEFPCEIDSLASQFDVKESRNGSFLVFKLTKKDARTSWGQYMRENACLDANPDPDT